MRGGMAKQTVLKMPARAPKQEGIGARGVAPLNIPP